MTYLHNTCLGISHICLVNNAIYHFQLVFKMAVLSVYSLYTLGSIVEAVRRIFVIIWTLLYLKYRSLKKLIPKSEKLLSRGTFLGYYAISYKQID